MESKYSQIKEAGLGLAAVSYDSPAVLKSFSDRMSITFPLLADRDSAIIRSFGILNEQVKKDSPIYGIPYPGIYVLDAQGHVTAKFFEDDYRQRDTAGLILLERFGIMPKGHATVAAKHITMNAAVTDETVRPGQRVSAVLDIAVPKGVHVYAPGVTGYKSIQWQIEPSAGFTAEAVKYPASRLMRLAAIGETVPVYVGHFRLTVDLLLANEKQMAALASGTGQVAVTSTVSYQACDASKCYLPETVPVTINLHYEPFDRTRVPESLQRK